MTKSDYTPPYPRLLSTRQLQRQQCPQTQRLCCSSNCSGGPTNHLAQRVSPGLCTLRTNDAHQRESTLASGTGIARLLPIRFCQSVLRTRWKTKIHAMVAVIGVAQRGWMSERREIRQVPLPRALLTCTNCAHYLPAIALSWDLLPVFLRLRFSKNLFESGDLRPV
jgi:hypothetical protein